MNDPLVQLDAFNQQLAALLIEQEVDWIQCLELVEHRDTLLKEYLDAVDQKEVEADKLEVKSLLEKTLELNTSIASRMKVEQNEAEQALLKVNQGKKARASYE